MNTNIQIFNNTNAIGITERGDAGLDFTWKKKMNLVAMAILITKNVNNNFIDSVLPFKNKVIIHATITGYGGTVLEPNVPDYNWSIHQLEKLIQRGFPADQIVVRIDPIIPTSKGLDKVKKVLDETKKLNIKRVRFSFLDMYFHVKERFKNKGIRIPYDKMPSIEDVNKCFDLFKQYSSSFSFESCAEKNQYQKGCISQTDIDILGLNIKLEGNKHQRKGCLCPKNKFELLENKKRCQHQCLYCYWQD